MTVGTDGTAGGGRHSPLRAGTAGGARKGARKPPKPPSSSKLEQAHSEPLLPELDTGEAVFSRDQRGLRTRRDTVWQYQRYRKHEHKAGGKWVSVNADDPGDWSDWKSAVHDGSGAKVGASPFVLFHRSSFGPISRTALHYSPFASQCLSFVARQWSTKVGDVAPSVPTGWSPGNWEPQAHERDPARK